MNPSSQESQGLAPLATAPDDGTTLESGGDQALVLGGGGLLGAVYEIGCLAGIEEQLGRFPAAIRLHVGTSGGAVVAALLAAGYSPSELVAPALAFSSREVGRLNTGSLVRASLRLPLLLARRAVAWCCRRETSWMGLPALLQEIVPAGLLALDPLQALIRRLLQERGLEDSFAALPQRLCIPAIDLDTGGQVVFGDGGETGVTVSQAVAASCALPRYFQPVRLLGGRDFIDGGIADVLNLGLAIARGAREILVVNPMVAPLNDRLERCLPSLEGGCGRIAEQGLVAVLLQAMRISHQMQSQAGMELIRATHPHVRIHLIQPDRMESDLDNPMDLSRREPLIERGRADGCRYISRFIPRSCPPPPGKVAAEPRRT